MIEEISANDVIGKSYIHEYEKQLECLWAELIGLNIRIFYIEKIDVFPLNLFLDIRDKNFWHTIKNSLLEGCISSIYRIGVDQGEDTLTLKKLKNNIFKNKREDIDDNVEKWLRQNLSELNFDKRLAKFEDQVREIRHNYYGHLIYETNINPDLIKIQEIALYLDDIQEMLDIFLDLFNLLCFNHMRSLWYWDHSENARKSNDTDIDRLLDLVAEHSHLLNAPEQNKDLWVLIRADYTDKEIEILNHYRSKLGMPRI